MTPTSPANTTTRAAKIRKLETCESLAMLTEPLTGPRSDAASVVGSSVVEVNDPSPLAIRVTNKHGLLVLLTAAAVVAIVALTLCFSRTSVVIETFERRAVTIAAQEKLLETYNSYSGTITAAIERPLELFMALVVQIVVLRLLATDVLSPSDTHWRVGVTALVLGAATTYLLANGLSAVNVQVREQPMRLVITAADLAVATTDPSTTSTFNQSLAEDRPGNPTTNTILRNLILPRATATKPPCYDLDRMDDVDDVLYRLPQRPWMKDLLPQALVPTKSLTIAVSKANAAANAALTPEDFPMNASLAADLLLYSLHDTVGGSAWGRSDLPVSLLMQEIAIADGPLANATGNVQAARRTQLLPSSLTTTERDDRAWFLANSGPTMFNISSPSYKNASLRSWTMTFSHVDIAPGVVWVDAVTIEREMATPRLQPNTGRDAQSRDFSLVGSTMQVSPNYVPLRKAGDATEERIDVYSVCVDAAGNDVLTAQGATVECSNQSTRSLLVVGRGKRLVADTVVIESFELSGTTVDEGMSLEGWGVVVNMREISTVTIAEFVGCLQRRV